MPLFSCPQIVGSFPTNSYRTTGPYNLTEPLTRVYGTKKDAYWARATASLLVKLFISSAVRQVVVRLLGEQCS